MLTDPELALYALGWLLLLLAVGTVVFRRFSSRAYAEARERVSVVNADLQENVSGVRIAQAYVREELSYDRFGERSDAYRRSRLRAQRYIATYFPFVGLLSDIATAVVLFVGGTRIVGGDITPGVLTAFLLYLTLFFGPVQQLSQVFDGYQQARVGLNRISELLRTPTSVPDEPQRPVPVPSRLRGEVELDHVTFRYPGSTPRPRRRVAARPRGSDRRAGGRDRRREVDADQADRPVLRHRRGPGPRRRRRRAPLPAGRVPVPARGGPAGGAPVHRRRRLQHRLRPPGRPAGADRGRARAVGALGLVRSLPQGFHTPVGERGRDCRRDSGSSSRWRGPSWSTRTC